MDRGENGPAPSSSEVRIRVADFPAVAKAGNALVTVGQLAVNAAGKSIAGVDNLTNMGHRSQAPEDDGKPESEISKAKSVIREMLKKCMNMELVVNVMILIVKDSYMIQ